MTQGQCRPTSDPLGAVSVATVSPDPAAPAAGESTAPAVGASGVVTDGRDADDGTGDGVTEASVGSGSVLAAGPGISPGALFAASLASSRLAASWLSS